MQCSNNVCYNKVSKRYCSRTKCRFIVIPAVKLIHFIASFFFLSLILCHTAFRGGLDPCHSQCVVMVHALIVTLTEKFQEFSKFIVDSGLLIEHIDQLCKMRDTSTVSHFVVLVVILIVITVD